MSKEIDFTNPNCTDTLASGLNLYSQNFDYEDSKRWALDWLKDNDPTTASRLARAKPIQFRNRGFVCRMIKRGLKVTEGQLKALHQFFSDTIVVEEESLLTPTQKIESPIKVTNTIIFQMEDYVDAVLTDKTLPNVLMPIDSKQINEAKSWLEKEIIEANEQIAKHVAILTKLEEIYTKCGGILQKSKSKTQPTAPKPATKMQDRIEKIQSTKDLVYMKQDPETNLTSISPSQVVGAKRAIFYDTQYKKILVFIAKQGQRLAINRSSIANFDPDTSFCQIVKKPTAFFRQSGAIAQCYNGLSGPSANMKKAIKKLISGRMIILFAENN